MKGVFQNLPILVGFVNQAKMSKEYDGSLYIIVNVSKPVGLAASPGMYYVLPGEESHTYGTLDEGVEEFFELSREFGHTLETAPIFELKPVSAERVHQAMRHVWRDMDVEEKEAYLEEGQDEEELFQRMFG